MQYFRSIDNPTLRGLAFHERVLILGWMYLFLLTPYFNFGGLFLHGGLAAMLGLLVFLPNYVIKAISSKILLTYMALLASISVWGMVVSLFYPLELGLGMQRYLLAVTSYLVFGASIGYLFLRRDWDFERAFYYICFIVVLIVWINAIVVCIGYFYPPFRAFTESFLELRGSNIDYRTREYRLRGIAGGGAANLSLMHGVAIVVSLALYLKGRISVLFFMVLSLTILTSLMFIGRTGIILAGVGCFLLLVSVFRRIDKKLLRVAASFIFVLLVILWLPEILSIVLPGNVLNYSLFFIYEGASGFAEQGTVFTLVNYFGGIDGNIALLIFGNGEHSGDFRAGVNADPGYLKTITSLGIPVAILFYCSVIYVSKALRKLSPFHGLVVVLLIIMFVSEFKEPFVVKGYFARFMWMLFGMSIPYYMYYLRQIESHYDGDEK